MVVIQSRVTSEGPLRKAFDVVDIVSFFPFLSFLFLQCFQSESKCSRASKIPSKVEEIDAGSVHAIFVNLISVSSD